MEPGPHDENPLRVRSVNARESELASCHGDAVLLDRGMPERSVLRVARSSPPSMPPDEGEARERSRYRRFRFFFRACRSRFRLSRSASRSTCLPIGASE